MRALLLVAAALALAGCANVYESGSDPPVDCDTTYNESKLDDGATSPLRCERTGNATNGTGDESSAPR